MCDLQYHNCPECGEEIKCYQRDDECPYTNGVYYPCEKCEYWMEELRKEEVAREERKRWEEEEWDRFYGYK